MTYRPTYYEVLGLPETLQSEANLPAQTLRGAYKRALLKNHPDKSKSAISGTYSIDQIAEAFSILSNSAARAQYNRELRLQSNTKKDDPNNEGEVFRTGIETVDLDDLEEDDAQNSWYRSCRRGDDRGFLIAEADLEEAIEQGELSVGCRGCSLWIKVLFGTIEETSNG